MERDRSVRSARPPDQPLDEDALSRATSDDPSDDDLAQLDPREAARMRRRDHDAEAEGRDLLRPGMGKVFKQILDRQAKRGREAKRPQDR